MDTFDYTHWSRRATEWAARYYEELPNLPVRAQTEPGDIMAQIAEAPPEQAENMEDIFADFERIIPDGMTHWQHPGFFAYFSVQCLETGHCCGTACRRDVRPMYAVADIAIGHRT